MSGALLEVSSLTIGAGDRTLVDALSMQVNAGEVWCVLGPNGAGKTLFLETVVGLRDARGGAIRIAGRPAQAWPLREAARLRAFLPQTLHDAFSATVLESVMVGRHPYLSRWGWEGEAERDLAIAALEAVDLRGIAHRDVTCLSGGERRRVAIAALLVQDTPLLLLDEPVAHLDLHHQITILEHLAGLARPGERAVVFSVHDLNLAARFATHAMLYMGEGEVRHGPAADVMEAGALARAFGHPVSRVPVGSRDYFIAA